MQRWIIIAVGIATAIIAFIYGHWVVLALTVALTLYVLFAKPRVERSARKPGRQSAQRHGKGDGGGVGGDDGN